MAQSTGSKRSKTRYTAGQALTLDEAKALRPGTTLYSRVNHNADGTCQRWKVNGQVKTWKRDASRVQVPVKHGMYAYDYVTENDLDAVSLSEYEEEVLSE